MSASRSSLSRTARFAGARRFLVAASALAVLSAAGSASAAVVYSNDFSVDAAGFSGVNTVQTSPDGTRFLGFLTNGGTADLTLSGLATHTSVNLTFDLYTLRSIDGDGQFCCGPDSFKVTLDDSTVLLDSTFANTLFQSNSTQSYPVAGSAPGAGSQAYSPDAFGYGAYYAGAYTYHFSFDVPSSASSIKFSFIGNSDQGWDDEGFGIDNVVVSTSAIPEPSTYALMLAGLGLGCLMVRRRSRR